jgi:hypothetical protein
MAICVCQTRFTDHRYFQTSTKHMCRNTSCTITIPNCNPRGFPPPTSSKTLEKTSQTIPHNTKRNLRHTSSPSQVHTSCHSCTQLTTRPLYLPAACSTPSDRFMVNRACYPRKESPNRCPKHYHKTDTNKLLKSNSHVSLPSYPSP